MRDVTVPPIYVAHPQRASVEIEQERMKEILALLRTKEQTWATFLPVRGVPLDSIPTNDEITKAYVILYMRAM